MRGRPLELRNKMGLPISVVVTIVLEIPARY